jgi:hypothetical protein
VCRRPEIQVPLKGDLIINWAVWLDSTELFGSRDAVELSEAVNVQETDIPARYCTCALGIAGRHGEIEHTMLAYIMRALLMVSCSMSSLQLCRKAKCMPSIGNVETKTDKRVTET